MPRGAYVKQKARTRRGVRTDPDIVQAIREQRRLGWNAAQIKRDLDTREDFRGRVPELRTVQAIVKRFTPRDTSGDWSVLSADAEEARWVLPVLGWWIDMTDGRMDGLTRRQGAWVAKLEAIAEGKLSPGEALGIADDLILAEDDEAEHKGLAEVELYLALLAEHGWSEVELSKRMADFVVRAREAGGSIPAARGMSESMWQVWEATQKRALEGLKGGKGLNEEDGEALLLNARGWAEIEAGEQT